MSRPQFYVPDASNSASSLPSGWQSVQSGPSPPFDSFSNPPGFSQPPGVDAHSYSYGPPGMAFGPPPTNIGMGGPQPNVGVGMAGPPGQAAASNPINDMLFGAGSGLIRSGLGAYGQQLLGNGRDYMQNNVGKYLASTDFHYYFHVNNSYVWNKLKVILLPFLHRGHWTRIAEQVAGGLTYKPPVSDINAPDLFIPVTAFASYVVIGSFCLGLQGRFSPASVNTRFGTGLVGWLIEFLFLRGLLYFLASGDAPLLDLLAYSGYLFPGIVLATTAWAFWRLLYYPIILFTSLCTAMFLVRTMKRVMFAETRHYERDSARHRYLLLLLAACQFPLALWLGKL